MSNLNPPTSTPQPIVFVVGPTATGKSTLSFELQSIHHFQLLSADSRQIYSGLEITTGTDLPSGFSISKKTCGGFRYFTKTDSIASDCLYGVLMLEEHQDWSIAHFRQYAQDVYQTTQKNNQRLLVVGGSGLYLESLFLDAEQLSIQPNQVLRSELEGLSTAQLQSMIEDKLPGSSSRFNHSDWNNSRRLIRFYEKSFSNVGTHSTKNFFGKPEDHIWIGLGAEKEILKENIHKRVLQRVQSTAIQEVEHLINHADKHSAVFTTTGVKEILGFLEGKYDHEQLIELWSKREFQYAKRQMTWFKKKPYIKWFDPHEIEQIKLLI